MIKRAIIAVTLVFMGSFGMAFVNAQPALAGACDESGRVLTLKPWFYGLAVDGSQNSGSDSKCNLKSPSDVGGFGPYIWRIALNLIEDLFQITGYIAAGYIIYGGFLFITSSGSPDRAVRGRKTVFNAIIGLVIAIASVGVVNWVSGALL